MTPRDSQYLVRGGPYRDIDWLLPWRIAPEDVILPSNHQMSDPDDNLQKGSVKDKLLELFEELNSPPLTQEIIDRNEPLANYLRNFMTAINVKIQSE